MTLARPVAGRVFDIEFAAWRGALGVDRAPHRLADFTGQCDAARLAGVGAAKPNNAGRHRQGHGHRNAPPPGKGAAGQFGWMKIDAKAGAAGTAGLAGGDRFGHAGLFRNQEGSGRASIEVDHQAKKRVAGRQVFLLERRQRLALRQPGLAGRDFAGGQPDGDGQLLDIDAPVAAALDYTTPGQQVGKYRMPMPAPGEVADLRPGVGIEHVMACQANIRCAQQAPEIDQIGAHEKGVGRQYQGFAPPDAVARLIDANDEMIGVAFGRRSVLQPTPQPASRMSGACGFQASRAASAAPKAWRL